MANSLFNELGGISAQTSQNPLSQFQQFMQNPLQYMLQRRINIPPQYMNDPKGAVEFLIRNGQMSQAQFNQLTQMAQQMGVRL